MHFTLTTALAALVATSTALPYVKDGESFTPDKRQAAAVPEGTGYVSFLPFRPSHTVACYIV